jgi:hypothetical protein
MSHIEQEFRQYLSKKPEIESCYALGLINRRSLARHLIRQGVIKGNQMDAAIAMLRRFIFSKITVPKELFKQTKITIKDRIIILDLEKTKEMVQKLQRLISHTDYDKGDTLKIVVGSSSVKVFIDQDKEPRIKEILGDFKTKHRHSGVSEVSIMFPQEATAERGILSTITRELNINNITVSELLTASPELLIYLKEEHVLKTYEILKRLQK